MAIQVADILEHNNPYLPLFNINSTKGFHVGSTISDRNAVNLKKRDTVFISILTGNNDKGVYRYIGGDTSSTSWENVDNWELIIGGNTESEENIWTIAEVSASTVASPFVYYLVTSTTETIMTIPEWSTGVTDEYTFNFSNGNYKVKVTDGITTWLIPTIGGTLKIKGNTDGWKVVEDSTGFSKYYIETEDRDFSDGDGFENNVTYGCAPSISGGSRIFTLPAPKDFGDGDAVKAAFTLLSTGSLSLVRDDGGLVAGQVQLTISTVGSTITLMESEGAYIIVQDSRPKSISNISLPFYRLNDISDVGGYYSLSRTKSDPRYGAETLLLTGSIAFTTYTTYISYITDDGVLPDSIPTSTVSFLVSTRRVSSVGSNVKAKYQLYKRNSGGTETLITESADFTIISTSFSQYTIIAEVPETVFVAGDRLVMKVLIARTDSGGTNPQLETKIEGAVGAYFASSVPSTQIKHNDLDGRFDGVVHESSGIAVGTEFVTTTTWGGIPAGTTILATDTIYDLFRDAIAPYIPSSFSAFSVVGDVASSLEVGETYIVASATYSTNTDSEGDPPTLIKISGVGFDNTIERVSSPIVADQAPFTITNTTVTSTTWTLSGEDANGDSIPSRTYTKSWYYKNKFGGSPVTVVDDATAQTVYNSLNQDWFDTNKGSTVYCDSNNENTSNWTYYMYPASYGDLSNVLLDGVSPIPDSFIDLGNFTIINAQGESLSVRVQKSDSLGAYSASNFLVFS